MALLSKTPRKQVPLNIYLRVLTIRIHPTSQAFMRVGGVLQGGLSSLKIQQIKKRNYQTRAEAKSEIFDYIEGSTIE
jgi:hypothetical protein